MTNIKVKKISPTAKLPARAHSTDAGADLFALERTVMPPEQVTLVRSGIAVALPDDTAGLIWGKSSVESKGVKVMAGLIDHQYRGEILICMYNLNKTEFVFEAGQKVAQLVIVPVKLPGFEEAAELGATARGEGRLGSTGSK